MFADAELAFFFFHIDHNSQHHLPVQLCFATPLNNWNVCQEHSGDRIFSSIFLLSLQSAINNFPYVSLHWSSKMLWDVDESPWKQIFYPLPQCAGFSISSLCAFWRNVFHFLENCLTASPTNRLLSMCIRIVAPNEHFLTFHTRSLWPFCSFLSVTLDGIREN